MRNVAFILLVKICHVIYGVPQSVCDGSDELWRDFVKKFEPCSLILRMRQWQSISHEIQIAHKVEVKGRDH